MFIEHAIHTSSQTIGNEGYQIVAASPGIGDLERSQLASWCPSHNGLLPNFIASGSISSFQLSDGHHWITRTWNAGNEYSNRGGYRLLTHCLRIPEAIFLNFANNPFAVMDAVVAGGYLDIDNEGMRDIKPFSLVGRARAFDAHRLSEWVETLGHHRIVDIVNTCCCSHRVAFVGGPEIQCWLASLINLFPVPSRGKISFCIGQQAVTSRPFQWMSAPNDNRLLRRWQLDGIRMIYCHVEGSDQPPPRATQDDHTKLHGWASFLAHCLMDDQLDVLKVAIGRNDTPADLESLGPYYDNRVLGTV